VIILDASVLIAHFESADAHHERATQLLVDAADESLGASPLTLAEVLVGPARTGKLDAAQVAIRDLDIASIALTDDAPARLATLRASTRLRLPDCCVLLAAETAGAQVATFDDRLASSAADLGLTVRN
jgi:predicted nucleic acid-binding protein